MRSEGFYVTEKFQWHQLGFFFIHPYLLPYILLRSGSHPFQTSKYRRTEPWLCTVCHYLTVLPPSTLTHPESLVNVCVTVTLLSGHCYLLFLVTYAPRSSHSSHTLVMDNVLVWDRTSDLPICSTAP